MSRYLFLTQLYPSGLSGTSVKTRHTIEYLLRDGHTVDVICIHHVSLIRPNDFVHQRLNIFVVPAQVMSSFSFEYFVKNVPLLLSTTPFRVKKLFSTQFFATAQTLLESHQYAQVFFDGFAMLQYAPLLMSQLKTYRSNQYLEKLSRRFVYIDDEDITDLMKQRLISTPNSVLKIFFYAEFLKCRRYERTVLPCIARIWAISPRTAAHFRAIAQCPVHVMPTIVAQRKNAFSVTSQLVMFTGLLSWMENTVGLEWFLKNVWPQVIKKLPKVRLMVVGQMAKPDFIALLQSAPNVIYKGYVADLSTVYKKSAVAIAPILTNCGIKVKIVTYLSYGLPVISTSTATWGLKSLDGILTADTATSFAAQLISVLEDSRLRQKLSRLAIKNIALNHSNTALRSFFSRAGLIKK